MKLTREKSVTTAGMLMGCALALGLAGCVTEEKPLSGSPSSVVSSGMNPNKEYTSLEANENGLVPAIVTRIIDPVTIVINANNPRTVKLAGVEPASQKEFPGVFDEGKAWLGKFIGGKQVIYILPLAGTDLNDPKVTITGSILLPSESGDFVDARQAMLSRGLIKITDMESFGRPEVARAAYSRQEEARNGDPANGKPPQGMWANGAK
jgi:hypothetical protein